MGTVSHPGLIPPSTDGKWLLRAARVEDVPALQSLIPISVRELHAGYYSPAQIQTALVSVFGVDTQLIEDGTYYVADAAGELVGCGGWSKRRARYGSSGARKIPDPEIDPASDPARIRSFFVHPAWVRRGIGRRILQECEQAIQIYGFQNAELVATLAGVRFYAAFGYTVAERCEIRMTPSLGLPVVRMSKTFA